MFCKEKPVRLVLPPLCPGKEIVTWPLPLAQISIFHIHWFYLNVLLLLIGFGRGKYLGNKVILPLVFVLYGGGPGLWAVELVFTLCVCVLKQLLTKHFLWAILGILCTLFTFIFMTTLWRGTVVPFYQGGKLRFKEVAMCSRPQSLWSLKAADRLGSGGQTMCIWSLIPMTTCGSQTTVLCVLVTVQAPEALSPIHVASLPVW